MEREYIGETRDSSESVKLNTEINYLKDLSFSDCMNHATF